MKFGVGVITTHRDNIKSNYFKYLDYPTTMAINVDEKREGIPISRNRVLKDLYEDGCTHIVIFDDDCYPVREGWQTYLRGTCSASGVKMLTMAPPQREEGRNLWGCTDIRWGMGCFTFITREVVDAVGYFNTEYDTYGYEDVAYAFRARKAGMTRDINYDCEPDEIQDYIFSEDAHSVVSERSARNNALDSKTKTMYIGKNREVFMKEISNDSPLYLSHNL